MTRFRLANPLLKRKWKRQKSKVVETKKGPVSVEVDAEPPMDLVIKKINKFKAPGPLESYLALKKELEWPKQFSSDQIADLEELANGKLDELRTEEVAE